MIFSAGDLCITFNKATFGVERLAIAGDAESLSWVRGGEFALPSGNNFLAKSDYKSGSFRAEFLYFSGLTCRLTVGADAGGAVFHYLFKNETKKRIETADGDLGIYLPFNDDFDDPVISIRRRVHAHVRAHGSAYIFCERYSGDLPAMGLVFRKGESFSYSLERTGKASSRGKVLLDLPPLSLEPDQTYECEFVLFSCTGREDFRSKAASYGLLDAEANKLVLFQGEELVLTSPNATSLLSESGEVPFTDGACRLVASGCGEKEATLLGGGKRTRITYFVLPDDVREQRARFVTEKQMIGEGRYKGAFTAYDRARGEKVVKGGVRSPFSLAGFRAAPLLFLLKQGRDKGVSEELRHKIEDAVAFYDREIYRGGEVADDLGGKRTRLFKRYYNYPLYAAIKYEQYRTFGDVDALTQGAEILMNLYRSGSVYEVAPTLLVCDALREIGKRELADALGGVVVEAADKLIKSGNKYAPFKGLPYGPEIVYGATSTLLDAYFLTEREYYLSAAKEHLTRLETFSYPSPDYKTDEVPEIFQKDRGTGLTYDMAPHFTAVHFALVYDKFFRATGEGKYGHLAEKIGRAALTLFDSDGGAVRSRAALRALNDAPLGAGEQISYGEDVVLYHFGLLFDRK